MKKKLDKLSCHKNSPVPLSLSLWHYCGGTFNTDTSRKTGGIQNQQKNAYQFKEHKRLLNLLKNPFMNLKFARKIIFDKAFLLIRLTYTTRTRTIIRIQFDSSFYHAHSSAIIFHVFEFRNAHHHHVQFLIRSSFSTYNLLLQKKKIKFTLHVSASLKL